MRGDEYVREIVRTYLETQVPLRLAAHLAAHSLTGPTPADVVFLLEDTLQGVTAFPAVLVRATSGQIEKWIAQDTYECRYDIQVIVACDHRVHGSFEGASADRDRVLTAVREALLKLVGLPTDVDIHARAMKWDTGAAVETLAGIPLAAGTVDFVARTVETVADLDAPEDMDAYDLDVTGMPADQTLPTT